jgi:hypothetical protein
MAVNYGSDIKPLFTEMDRNHMLKMFDLWSYDAVKANAAAIYSTVESGKMPPPGTEPRWTADKVQKLKQWIDDGCLP